VLPYASARQRSLAHVLIEELDSGKWTRFRAAVAFAGTSANTKELVASLRSFAAGGGEIAITFGADAFGEEAQGSEALAVEQLLNDLHAYPTARVFLYHEDGRIFHPKVYLFDSLDRQAALVIVGSSNWTRSGQIENVEANAIVPLNLGRSGDLEQFKELDRCFVEFWSEAT